MQQTAQPETAANADEPAEEEPAESVFGIRTDATVSTAVAAVAARRSAVLADDDPADVEARDARRQFGFLAGVAAAAAAGTEERVGVPNYRTAREIKRVNKAFRVAAVDRDGVDDIDAAAFDEEAADVLDEADDRTVGAVLDGVVEDGRWDEGDRAVDDRRAAAERLADYADGYVDEIDRESPRQPVERRAMR